MMKFIGATALLAGLAYGQFPTDVPGCATRAADGTWTVDRAAAAVSACAGQSIQTHPQNGYPDHHPRSQNWWMKRMSDTKGADEDHHDRLFIGGTPAERDVKFLYEGAVDAVLNVRPQTTVTTMGTQELATAAQEAAICAEAGILYYELAAGADITSTAVIDDVVNFLDFALANTGQASSGNGPVYIHDTNGFEAAAMVQLYRARKGLIPGAAGTKTDQAIRDALNHGLTLSTEVIAAIARETGETAPTSPPALVAAAKTVADESITNYNWLKYLYNIGPVGIFDAGQVQRYHVKALQAAKVKVVIQMRVGGPTAGEREPVNLLNLKGGGGSKSIKTTGQAAWNATNYAGQVVAKERPASWACTYPADITWDGAYQPCVPNTDFNFEASNSLEWGDDIGLNTVNEGVDMEAAGIKYMHLQVGLNAKPTGVPFDKNSFLEYAPKFLEAVEVARAAGGHVLFHCTIGYRTGAFPTALLGLLTRGAKANYEPQTRAIVPAADAAGLSQDELNDMMHSWGYDVKDKQTGHRFEVGTDKLFTELSQLEFKGTVDWDTAAITGSIAAVPTQAPTPAPPVVGSPASSLAVTFGAVLAAVVAAAAF